MPSRIHRIEREGNRGVVQAPQVLTEQAGKRRRVRVPGKVIVDFVQELSSLLKAGVQIVQALQGLEEAWPAGQFKQVLSQLADSISNGGKLSDAMSEFPSVFDREILSMVKAGETAGELDDTLVEIAKFLQFRQQSVAQVKGAVTYPVFVIAVACLVIAFVMLFVIPKFKDVFQQMDVELPLPTVVLLGVASWCLSHWYLLVVLPIALLLLLQLLLRREYFARIADKTVLRLPVLGKLIRVSNVARFARVVGTLSEAGISILDALDLAKDSVRNRIIASQIADLTVAVRGGAEVAPQLKVPPLGDPLLHLLVNSGERTGGLSTQLLRAAERYEQLVSERIKAFTRLLEPALIVVLAVFVGFIVVALFMPILRVMDTMAS